MTLATLAALLLAAEPTMAVPGLTGIGIDPDRLVFFNEHTSAMLRSSGINVVTQKEIAVMLGIERQKQLLGCSDENATSCNTELANALGSDTVLVGDIAKLETGWYQVNLKVLSAKTGRAVTARSGRVPTEAALVDSLSRAANEMAREVFKALQPDVPIPQIAYKDLGRYPFRRLSWAPLAVTVVGGVVGAITYAQASDVHWQLSGNPATRYTDQETNDAVLRGRTAQTISAVAVGVAAAGVAVAAFLFLYRDEPLALQALLFPRDSAAAAGGWP